jgi:hypothetical protein
MDELTVLDPTAEMDVERIPLAPRRADLAGARIGILDNSKEKADEILRRLEERLKEQFAVGPVVWRRKEFYTKQAPVALIEDLARQCDVVLSAVGG